MNELPYLAAPALRHEWAGREYARLHAEAVEARLTARARTSERAARRRALLRAGIEGLLEGLLTARRARPRAVHCARRRTFGVRGPAHGRRAMSRVAPGRAGITPKVTNLVIDCSDLDVMAAFWGGLLRMKMTGVSEDWLDLEPLGGNGPCLSFQRVPEGKTRKNRIHLDLAVPDIEVAGKRAASLGATPAAGPMGNPSAPFRVWRDPEGNEFCLCTDS